MRPVTEVAAAVIERPDGSFLLACRPEGKPYPGYWEFPGGKIEPGESALQALLRELQEELDILVREASPWITRQYEYTHASVRLHFFRVTAWDGEPRPLEGQGIAWQRPGAPDVAPMLPANAPVLASLALPSVMVVSNASETSFDQWILGLSGCLAREKAIVQIREKGLDPQRVQHLLSRTLARTDPFGVPVVVNSDCGPFPQARGVHLTSAALAAAGERPPEALVGASCHTRAELEKAAALGLDYAVVGPVKPTASHPGAPGIGWDAFGVLVAGSPMPVYAIGGLVHEDLAEARRHGAHGVALRSSAFA